MAPPLVRPCSCCGNRVFRQEHRRVENEQVNTYIVEHCTRCKMWRTDFVAVKGRAGEREKVLHASPKSGAAAKYR